MKRKGEGEAGARILSTRAALALMRPERDAGARGGVRSGLLDLLRGGGASGSECLRASLFSWRDAHLGRARALARGEVRAASAAEARALGTLYGMAVGDAIGARVEFEPVVYGARTLAGMGTGRAGAFGLAPGQWTDDTAQGLCVADSLLACGGVLDAHDVVHRLLAWWHCGYNTAFRLEAGVRHAVGLGGNVARALAAYVRCPRAATAAGDAQTSGNGSVMRNAAVAVCFHADCAAAEAAAAAQSRATHQGAEAAECCRLLAHIGVRALHSPLRGAAAVRAVLGTLGDTFASPVAAVHALACAQCEPHGGADRDWRWRRADGTPYRYSPARTRAQPGYVGSYAMDAVAMALHCVWSTDSFAAAVLKAANLRGDADSVAAVAGQVAGAFYGIDAVPRAWVATIARWDAYTIALRAYRLFHGIWWSPSEVDNDKQDFDDAFLPVFLDTLGTTLPDDHQTHSPPPPSRQKVEDTKKDGDEDEKEQREQEEKQQ